jgi:hypothetical protein
MKTMPLIVMAGDRSRLWGTKKMYKPKAQVPALDGQDNTLVDLAKALADELGRTTVLVEVDRKEVVVKPRDARTLDS